MSYLDKLLDLSAEQAEGVDACLSGRQVEWKTLGEVVVRTKGTNITAGQMKELNKDGSPLKIFAGGKTVAFFDYDDIPSKDINRESSIIVKSRGVIEFEYYDKPFSHKNEMWSYHSKDENISIKFVYYFLKINELYFQNIGSRMQMPQISIPDTDKFKIPIPPLSVQAEIVRILDTFTELEVELAAELQKRRVQYKYYSTLLFDNVIESNFHSIIEVCNIEKGVTPIQKAIPGKYPMVVTTTERKSCETYQFNAKAVCIPLVSSRGHGVASLNHVYYQEGKFALGNILCAIIPKNEEQVYSKYLYYYFEQTKEYTLVPLMKGGANVALRMNDIEKVKVPIPSLEEQYRIVSILDKFDTLTTSISEGLPKEIELRKKQYEYYRDLLLTFRH
jgi:type I restriction enzyme, S subunit